ncbi:hypothetical protein [Paludibacterium paludis]|uniref:Lectin-like protein BA14k n=1 Tax=Paludibacterium paludis TaxID=1225769 RepID=A0A918P357_9NEIS|nr:hypothetical protein [Paludibacterium paludis]GGY16304.1 hypothetical protein GCM10011289_19430 [Paludibacterium paludis]
MAATLTLATVMALGLLTPAAAETHDSRHPRHGPDRQVWRSGHWLHGDYRGRFGWWWVSGGVWFFYNAPVYPYPDPYAPSAPMPAPTPPVPPSPPEPESPATAVRVWYFCPARKQYYPYVSECPGGWRPAPAATGR